MRKSLLALLLLLGCTTITGATTVADLCAEPGNQQGSKACVCTASPAKCRFTRMAAVTSPSTLDFGARALELAPGAKIDAGTAGILKVQAPSVDLQSGSGLLAPSGKIEVVTTGNVSVRRNGSTRARISVNGSNGQIIVTSGGEILVEGDLDAGTTALSELSAGDVDLAGRIITVSGDIDISGSTNAIAGTLLMTAGQVGGVGGDIVLAGSCNIRAGGSDGAGVSLDLQADGEVKTDARIELFALDASFGGDGGALDIDASGAVRLGGNILATGASSNAFSGSGGDINVEAGGSITVKGLLDVSGPAPGGDAGDVTLDADVDILQEATPAARINCSGPQLHISGGSAVLTAGRAITLGNIDCGGGEAASAGSVDVEAACSLNFPKTRIIDARGPDGTISLYSGGSAIIAGSLRSAFNELLYYDTQPVTTGAFIDGPLVVMQNTRLSHCGPPPVCGNGVMEPGEECDDNNQVDCDGCQADCSFVTCGDGDIECDEQADDGNNVSCDGTSSDCRPELCGNGIQECGEACDAGQLGSDSCTPQCIRKVPPGCGTGGREDGEACDDNNKIDCDGCSHFCEFDGCGSGTTEEACGEQCDEGDVEGGDGCSATCQIEACGNSVTDLGEDCDTGAQNGVIGTICSANCELAWCGNHKVDPGEACDDANQNECDGCSSSCGVPALPCPVCTPGATEQCVPCADTIDCDPLRACGSAACVAGVCTAVTPPSCDDGNGCTTDLCDPARGCVSAPIVCNDATACDGTASCNPATGQCVSSAAPDCDDADECTDDACSETVPGFQCSNQLRLGLDGASCRLSALQRLIDSPEIPNATRKKLRKQASAIARKLPAAAGTGKKAQKAKKQVTKGLKMLNKTISKARAKIPPETFTQLGAAATRFSTAFARL